MLYLWLKYIHILSSTILFGTGLGTAAVMLYGHLTKDKYAIAAILTYVVLADWCFTTTAGIIQPLTGFLMVYIAGFNWHALWIIGAIIGYTIAACCWFPVVYLQMKMRNFAQSAVRHHQALPPRYYRYFKIWFTLGWPAFISLIIVFYLMTFKPAIY